MGKRSGRVSPSCRWPCPAKNRGPFSRKPRKSHGSWAPRSSCRLSKAAGDEVSHVVAGLVQSSAEGQRLLDARWRVQVDGLADVVIAQVSGDPSRHTFPDLARAAASASRVVAPEGRIIVVSGGTPDLGPVPEMSAPSRHGLSSAALARRTTTCRSRRRFPVGFRRPMRQPLPSQPAAWRRC